jgi:transcription antitermination factor NusG
MKKIIVLIAFFGLVGCVTSGQDPYSCDTFKVNDHVRVIHGRYKGQEGKIRKVAYMNPTCNIGYDITKANDEIIQATGIELELVK